MEEQLYIENEGVLLRQIPIDFKQGKILCSITNSINLNDAQDSLTQVKSYYIIVEKFLANEKIEYVATMFPLYDGAGFNDKCTFLNKGNFSGLIIYSTLGGEFSRIEHFKKGLLLKGSLLESGEIKDDDNVMYLAVYPTVQTKSDGTDDGDEYDGGILPPIIVTPTAPPASQPKDNQSMEEEESGGGGPSGSDLYKDDNSGGGGGGSSGGNYNSGQTYTVSVTVSMLSNGFGSVTGSGEYTAGSSAAIVASPVWEYQFYNWSGDFAGKPSSFSFQVEKDVSAEANFRIIDLCIDAINNKSNPLRVMKLAPPKNLFKSLY